MPLERSPCCNARVDFSLADGVQVGSCETCGKYVVRVNPRSGAEEFLDGESPWFEGDLRPVDPQAADKRQH